MESDDLPTRVAVDRAARTLTLEWNGRRPTVIPWDLMRISCPCAMCKGETGTAHVDREKIISSDSETDMVDVTIVGSYAVQPE